jgi:hypothetical protein
MRLTFSLYLISVAMIHNNLLLSWQLLFSQRMFSRHVANSSHALNYLLARSSAFRFAVNSQEPLQVKFEWKSTGTRNAQINLNIIKINYPFNYKNVSSYHGRCSTGQSVLAEHKLGASQGETGPPGLSRTHARTHTHTHSILGKDCLYRCIWHVTYRNCM